MGKKKLLNKWKGFNKIKKISVICAIAFLILIGTGVWYYSTVIARPDKTLLPKNSLSNDPAAANVPAEGDSLEELNKWKPDDYYDKNIVNFVLLGFDTNDARRDMSGKGWGEGFAGARPDSIRVISINLDTMTSAVISIPRDTYIQIADTSTKDKINSSYAYGRMAARNKGLNDEEKINAMGMEYVMKTIENVLGGVPMDYYMAVDFDTVVKFVDKIGGIRYDVDIEVRHPQTGQLMLEKGMQTMNGTQAFIYLQDRVNTSGGDMGRTQNHTMFLKAMMKQLVDERKLLDALRFVIFDESMGTVSTNMSVDQIMSAGYIAKELNLTDINPFSLECRNKMMDGISYVVMDQQKRAELIKKVFDYDFTPPAQEHLIDTVPKPPTGFTATATGDGVVLNWKKGDVHNRAFNIWRNGTLIASTIAENMFLDPESPGGSLNYELQAVNGESVSTRVSATVQSGPSAPTNLKAIYNSDSNTVRLTWDYGGDRASFTIYKSDGDGGGARIARNLSDNSYNDGDIRDNTTYTYRVAAVSNGKEGAAATVSITVNIETTPTPEPTVTPATKFTMTINMSGNGHVEAGETKFIEQTTTWIRATPNGDSEFDHWEITSGSENITIDNPENKNTNITVSGNCTVTAVFTLKTTEPPKSRLTIVAGVGGTVNSGGDYAEGEVITITATPDSGYEFDCWSGSDRITDTESSGTTITMGTGDITITATFTEIVVTTDPPDDDGGESED